MQLARALAIGLILSGCALSPQKRGTVTVEGMGTKVLTEKGDQLMQTGAYAKREVSADFAGRVREGAQ
jgi:hypothetical protein